MRPEQYKNYIRRCICGNFHNWLVLQNGVAICGDCNKEHPPKKTPLTNVVTNSNTSEN